MDRLARRDEAERGNRFVVDTTSATLATNRVVVQRTQIGYVCVGMGRGSRLLHRAFDDASTSATDDALAKAAASAIVDVPLATHGDPHLRRLALMVALAKEDGFDPSEPRDERGRWTTGGVADGATASGASAGAGADEAMAVGAMAIGATATTDAGIGPALAELGPAAISSLSRLVGGVLAGGGAGLVAFLGTLLMRSQTGAVTEGRLPERDDIRFRYDDTTRGLAIYQQDTGGQERLVFSGQANPEDNLFRNEAGEPIGIRLASGVLIDPYAFPGYFEEEDEGEDAGAAPRTRTVAEAQRDKARLCPDWSKENIKGRSPGAVAYQSQIAHMPPEWDIKFRAVRYDGCDEATGDLSDAKFGFAKFMTGPDTWYPWFRGVAKLERQMKRQSDNAPDRTIDWHFSEDGPARFFAARAERPPNIVVHYTKPMWQPSHEDMYRSHIVGTRKGAPMPWPLLRSPSSTMLPTQRYLAGPT